MIHLVIVSHSRQLALGLADLARQMAPPDLILSAVGGAQDGHGQVHLGTDAVAIVAAVEAHPQATGVLILVDLGSAVLSAETALDLLAPEIAARCIISNAPLVEGTIIAAIEAGLGRSLDEINAAAEAVGRVTKVLRATA
jgi:PTS hybrid protein